MSDMPAPKTEPKRRPIYVSIEVDREVAEYCKKRALKKGRWFELLAIRAIRAAEDK